MSSIDIVEFTTDPQLLGLTLSEAHRISDTVEAQLLAAFPRAEVMIHQDPEGIEEPRRTFPPARPSSKLAS